MAVYSIIVITFTRAATQRLSVMNGCVSQHHFYGETRNFYYYYILVL